MPVNTAHIKRFCAKAHERAPTTAFVLEVAPIA
jgi:hypothetical protein